MANLQEVLKITFLNEGGGKLHTVSGDRGGQTIWGIARNFWGTKYKKLWNLVDAGHRDSPQLMAEVEKFYRKEFWNKIKGDDIKSQRVAFTIFDYGMNTGITRVVKMAQIAVKATPDGKFGPNTLKKINEYDPEEFMYKIHLTMLARYAAIVTRNRSQKKFLLGWCNRILKNVARTGL